MVAGFAIVPVKGYETIDMVKRDVAFRMLVKFSCAEPPQDCMLVAHDLRSIDRGEPTSATDLYVKPDGRIKVRSSGRWVVEFGAMTSVLLTVDVDTKRLEFYDKGLGTLLQGSVDCPPFGR